MTRKKFIKNCMALGISRNDARKIAKLGVEHEISYHNNFSAFGAVLVGIRMMRALFPATSTGDVLDRHAITWGLKRKENESDDDLRKRIFEERLCKEREHADICRQTETWNR